MSDGRASGFGRGKLLRSLQQTEVSSVLGSSSSDKSTGEPATRQDSGFDTNTPSFSSGGRGRGRILKALTATAETATSDTVSDEQTTTDPILTTESIEKVQMKRNSFILLDTRMKC